MSAYFSSLVSAATAAATAALTGTTNQPFPYKQLDLLPTSITHPHPFFSLYSAVALNTPVQGTEPITYTIFQFDKTKSPDSFYLLMARNYIQKLKTLRHPHILKYIDSIETDKHILICTEECRPYSHDYNKTDKKKESQLALGLYAITSAISFLNNDCKLVHGALSPAAIYLTKSGEYKLGTFDITYKYADNNTSAVNLSSSQLIQQYRNLFLPIYYRPPEYSKSPGTANYYLTLETDPSSPAPAHYIDAWCLGVLYFDCYANGTLSAAGQLMNKDVLPVLLQSEYKRLLSTNPIGRLNPKVVLESKYFIENELVKTIIFLDQLALKGSEDKEQFFSSLIKHIDTIPISIAKYKILPQLLTSVSFGAGLSSFAFVLTCIFKIASSLTTEEYTSIIVPPIIKLFASNERAVRVHLLQQIDSYAPYLSAESINETIFTHILTGFTDSAPLLREVTVKSMPALVSKLNSTHLESALRFLSRLQTDIEPAIRTNTTYCIAKMAVHFNTNTREKVLIPAFSRSLRDPFVPARIAGLVSMAVTLVYQNVQNIAKKVLPAVSSCCVDENKDVREAALKCINNSIKKLTHYHTTGEDPVVANKAGDENKNDATSVASQYIGSMTSWAVSSFTSKLYGDNKDTSNANSNATSNVTSPTNATATTKVLSTNAPSSSAPTAATANASHVFTPSSTTPYTAPPTPVVPTNHGPASTVSAHAGPVSATSPFNPSTSANNDGWDAEFFDDDMINNNNTDTQDDNILSLSTKKKPTATSSSSPTPQISATPTKTIPSKKKPLVKEEDDFTFQSAPTPTLDNWDWGENLSLSSPTKNINDQFDPLSNTNTNNISKRVNAPVLTPPPTAGGNLMMGNNSINNSNNLMNFNGLNINNNSLGGPSVSAKKKLGAVGSSGSNGNLTGAKKPGLKPEDDWSSFLNE